LGTAQPGVALPCHPLYSMRRPSAAGLEPGGLVEDAHTLRLADLTPSAIGANNAGRKTQGMNHACMEKKSRQSTRAQG